MGNFIDNIIRHTINYNDAWELTAASFGDTLAKT
jgi:hypothetical protein